MNIIGLKGYLSNHIAVKTTNHSHCNNSQPSASGEFYAFKTEANFHQNSKILKIFMDSLKDFIVCVSISK